MTKQERSRRKNISNTMKKVRATKYWHNGNKGKITLTACVTCSEGFKRNKISQIYCSKSCVPSWNKGKKWTKEMRQKLSGSKANGWRGGVSTANEVIRKSIAMKTWRTNVFKRDDYTCQSCGVKGDALQADHIKQFAYHPDLRFELDNGQTLCLNCHLLTETWGRRVAKL